MTRYVVRQLVQTLPLLGLICLASFTLIQLAPGGPAQAFQDNPYLSQVQVDRWLAQWCLQRNPGLSGTIEEFAGWLGVWNCTGGGLMSAHGVPNALPAFLGGGTNGVVHGDLGYSLSSGAPVMSLILDRLPATLILMISAWLVWILIATIVGVLGSVYHHSVFDRVSTIAAYMSYSLPTFWLGLLLIYGLSVALGWFPAQGIVDVRTAPAPFGTAAYWQGFLGSPLSQILDIGRHLALPAATVVAIHAAEDSRFVRAAMLDVLDQDFIRAARAKGITERRVVLMHGLRNALLPLLTKLPLEVAFLFQGAVIAETIFNWPGIGLLFYQGLVDRDYFLLMGILLVGALLIVLANIVADVLYAIADPRVRLG